MNCNLAVIKGDGIGPEIVTEAMRVLDAVGEKYGHTFSYTQILMGEASIDVHGEPLTEEALEIAKKSDAVLMGSIGGNTSTSQPLHLPDVRDHPGRDPAGGGDRRRNAGICL